MLRRAVWFCVALAFMSTAGPLRASEPSGARPESESPTPSRRALSAGAAVVPGALVHGTGHWVLGEPATARKLLLIEGIGLGLFLGSGAAIVATGASRYVVGPAAVLTIAGVGLFSTSMLADVYGALASEAGAARPLRTAPWIETELGYRHVADANFAYASFAVQRIASRVGRFRLEPSLWTSLAADNARYRGELGYRFWGPIPDETSSRPSHVELETALTYHHYVPERFAIGSAELSLSARYDLGVLGRTLRGAFVEGGAGAALQRFDYDLAGISLPAQVSTLLLARFGFGMVLRGASGPGSDVLAFYDHRHDGYAAGLKVKGLGSGVAGHFGVAGRWFFGESLGVLLDARAGSAYVLGGSMLFRQGARR